VQTNAGGRAGRGGARAQLACGSCVAGRVGALTHRCGSLHGLQHAASAGRARMRLAFAWERGCSSHASPACGCCVRLARRQRVAAGARAACCRVRIQRSRHARGTTRRRCATQASHARTKIGHGLMAAMTYQRHAEPRRMGRYIACGGCAHGARPLCGR
jgi:hypothetical protein